MTRLIQAKAFTLVEMMLALGIFTLIAGLVITNIGTILSSFNKKSLPQILKSAVRETRYLAAIRKEPAYLGFDDEIKQFIITDIDGQILDAFDSGYQNEAHDIEVAFYQILPERGMFYPTSQEQESEQVNWIVFHPDRSSTPFFVSLDYNEEKSNHHFDPFSDLEFVKENK